MHNWPMFFVLMAGLHIFSVTLTVSLKLATSLAEGKTERQTSQEILVFEISLPRVWGIRHSLAK
jgi:hypothetical protein